MIGSPSREHEANRAGCTGLVDYHRDDVEVAAREFAPAGFDMVIDAIGTTRTANLSLQCLHAGGTLGIYGMDGSGSLVLDHGNMRGTVTVYGGAYDEGEAHDDVCTCLDRGMLDPSIWIDAESAFDLSHIADAFAAIRSRSQVKPLIRMSE